MTPAEIGKLLERTVLNKTDLTLRNAQSEHFTRDEALRLVGKKVRFRIIASPQERKGFVTVGFYHDSSSKSGLA